MRILLFGKIIGVLVVLSLITFLLVPNFILFAQLVAASILFAIAVTLVYPEIRGLKRGDTVLIVNNNAMQMISLRFGTAAQDGKKNNVIKVELGDGNEVMGKIESYDGLITPPRVQIVYEEKIVELDTLRQPR